MRARMWHTRWIVMGLAVLMAVGCQSPPKNAAVNAPPQMAVKQPARVAELQEGPAPEIFPDTHVAAGRLHESQGKLDRAAEQYRLAIAAKPNHAEAHNRLGVVLDQLGKFAEADQALARAIQLAPRRAYLHNNLGFSYIMQGRWAEAQTELTKALELQPEFPRARVNLGTVLAQRGRFEEAFENFRQVLRTEDAYYNVGLMYQSKRRPVEAAQAFKQALQANPKTVSAQKRLDMLPQGALAEADQRGALFAFPVALTGKTEPQGIPATRPADGSLTLWQAAAQNAADSQLSATQPANGETAADGDPLVERNDANESMFPKLTTQPADIPQQSAGRGDPAELIRHAIAPMEELILRLQSLQTGGNAEETSPLPPEVPAPGEGEPAADDVKVPGSSAP